MGKKAFVDFDGTIVNVYRRYFTILNEFLVSQKSDPIKEEKVFIELKRHGIKDHLIVEALSPFISDAEFPIETYLEHKRKCLEQRDYLQLDSIIGDPFLAYQKLKEKNYWVMLLSKRNNPRELQWQINSIGGKICDEIFCASDTHLKNPKYQFLKEIAAKGDFIIGDSNEDMEAGFLLQIDSYFVQTGLAVLEKKFSDVKQFANYNECVDWLCNVH